ncbi:hypothetical protein ABIA33_001393 [Streptacidiphilus sp. MAP12-16]|uniref:hypothetical protein n=1 Tax=Streptacidiphilus sp. MAP12-16 TaxID=3156300 RepID=UPI00351600A1
MNGTTMRDGNLERTSIGVFKPEISQSDWITILEQMRCRRILLLELDAPDGVKTPQVAKALDYYRRAEKHYQGGVWRLTVEGLRQSLAALVGKKAQEGPRRR